MAQISTQPYPGQKPGTSGLRKRVIEFQQPHYLENFIQAVFNSLPELRGATLVIGGDGRFYNQVAIQTLLKMAAANGVAKVWVGRQGWLSTPAVSALIRRHSAAGGFILSASHNPGGPQGDFGIKFNSANGGPANDSVTANIYAASQTIERYSICQVADVALDQPGHAKLADMDVEVIDPVTEYADLMESLFDFSQIRALLAEPEFTFYFDAMHAITGPYAQEIFSRRLGLPTKFLLNCEPLEDFGGGHPDPNLAHADDLLQALQDAGVFSFGGASDGDGDRNMLLAQSEMINPCDSIALLAANAEQLPGYRGKLNGVARSMPTSRALDRVAAELNIPCYQTPTGWKYFGSLLDAGKITLCGEESFGTGSNHLREKDGLWAVLFWLNLIALERCPAQTILRNHWMKYGRDFFTRHDYEQLDSQAAEKMLASLQEQLPALPGRTAAGLNLTKAESFSYTDSVDGSVSRDQGIILEFSDGSRAVVRLSGTGTAGATLRLYFDRHEMDTKQYEQSPQQALMHTISATLELLDIRQHCGRSAADVIT